MIHVASHPPSFTNHRHHLRPRSPLANLPRTLARPPFKEVPRDAIAAAAPELADVPAEYIRCNLLPRAQDMLAGIQFARPALPCTLPRSHLPSTLTLPVPPYGPQEITYPTHILAVSSKSSANDNLSIFPVHALVLAAHCAQLPRLPPSSPSTLPVLPLSVPSAAAFSLLLTYLYSHRSDTLLSSLFPSLPLTTPSTGAPALRSPEAVRAALSTSSPSGIIPQLSHHLAASAKYDPNALALHAAHVRDLWQVLVALGVHHPALWDTLDLAWEIVLGAFNLVSSA